MMNVDLCQMALMTVLGLGLFREIVNQYDIKGSVMFGVSVVGSKIIYISSKLMMVSRQI